MSDPHDTIKSYILREFLAGENPDELTDTTPLVTGGILDSIATVKLVTYLEETYGIEFAAHEMDAEHLNTILSIVELIRSKKQ